VVNKINQKNRKPVYRVHFTLCVLLFVISGHLDTALARTLEPRAYNNAPTGLNFLLAGYQNSSGALLFDPAIPITDAHADIDVGLLGYVHTFGIASRSAKIGLLLPYASLTASGKLSGEPRTRDTEGLADPSFYFTYNLIGAPALSLEDFSSYQQDTIIGFTFKLTAPLGVYDSSKLINIGTNRWSLEPGFGISQAIQEWTLEASVAAVFYTDNEDFDNGKTRQQDAIYSTQLHVTYNFPHNIWAAVSATYFTGGRTTIEGVSNNDLQQNWRTGFTLALPVNRYNSIKLYGSSGVSTRTGTNYDALGIVWQHRWGGGL
jgi:hypothetical protein